jgi:hypothetical protein
MNGSGGARTSPGALGGAINSRGIDAERAEREFYRPIRPNDGMVHRRARRPKGGSAYLSANAFIAAWTLRQGDNGILFSVFIRYIVRYE